MKQTKALGLDQSQDEAELSQLMKRSQNGDADSYRQLLIRIRGMLAKYIDHSFAKFRRGAGSGQEDVLQEILLAIHAKRHTYDPEQFFLPWMYAIARYKLIDFFRKDKIHLEVALEDELVSLEQLAVLEDSAESDVEALLALLPEKQQAVLRLVKLEGLSIAEVAQKTGYSISDIKVTIHRALKALQEKVKEAPREN